MSATVNIEDFATECGIGEKTVKEWCASGLMPAINVGTNTPRYRIPLALGLKTIDEIASRQAAARRSDAE